MIGQRIERIKDGIASKARSEGLQEGRQKGLQEGRHQERRVMLKELIEHKFGAVDQQLDARLQEASLDHLLEWSRKTLAAATLDEVFADGESAAGGAEAED